MRGSIPPLPQYAFMEWCLLKKSTGTTLPFTLNIAYPCAAPFESQYPGSMKSVHLSACYMLYFSTLSISGYSVLFFFTVLCPTKD
jgi:hypothetical protein